MYQQWCVYQICEAESFEEISVYIVVPAKNYIRILKHYFI